MQWNQSLKTLQTCCRRLWQKKFDSIFEENLENLGPTPQRNYEKSDWDCSSLRRWEGNKEDLARLGQEILHDTSCQPWKTRKVLRQHSETLDDLSADHGQTKRWSSLRKLPWSISSSSLWRIDVRHVVVAAVYHARPSQRWLHANASKHQPQKTHREN